MTTTAYASSVLFAAVLVIPTDAFAQRPKCSERDGRCVMVQVNGQTSVALTKQTKKALEGVKAMYVSQTRFELTTPVRGDIDVRAVGAPGADAWFGDLGSLDVTVIPLQKVDVKTRQEQTTNESVRVGGAPMVTEQSVLEGNRLPPGRYLLVVTLRGSANWDRQVLFFQVADN
jgi:hypothetical protein